MEFLRDIETLLDEEGIIPSGQIEFGSGADIPAGDGLFVSVIQYGGAGFDDTHDSSYQRPGAQITVRSNNPFAAAELALRICRTCHAVTNRVIGTTWYRSIRAAQLPGDAGPDDTRRPQMKFNVIGDKLPEGES